MALFQIEPCTKCGSDVWRLVSLGRATEQADLVCLFCGRDLRIDRDTRAQGGREA